MPELISLLTFYYACTALAEVGELTQAERFACNHSYQQVKRMFLEEELRDPAVVLTGEQNVVAYRRFKAWEGENAALVRNLKAR